MKNLGYGPVYGRQQRKTNLAEWNERVYGEVSERLYNAKVVFVVKGELQFVSKIPHNYLVICDI